jgi:hypothetical protein
LIAPKKVLVVTAFSEPADALRHDFVVPAALVAANRT